jgi:assimilatory nitrate reductase electron transfer subunit
VLSDPARGAYGKLVVRSGRLTGAILVGVPAAVGTVTQLFDRGGALPPDRAGLLLTGRRSAAVPASVAQTPERMPRTATVCRCNGVTKGTIQDAVLAGADGVQKVAAQTRATTGCGGCRDAVAGIVDWLRATEPDALTTDERRPA